MRRKKTPISTLIHQLSTISEEIGNADVLIDFELDFAALNRVSVAEVDGEKVVVLSSIPQ